MSSSTVHDYEKSPHHPHTSDQEKERIETEDSTFDYNEKTEDIDIENVDSEKSIEGTPHTGVPIGPGAPLGLTKTSSKIGVPVSKVNTRVSVNNTSQIPNGGTMAWIQVLGSFFLFFNTWYVCLFCF
jgi:hypothetical protein